ncbi:MAG: S8 family serine peptidase [Bacteroidales bacterium]
MRRLIFLATLAGFCMVTVSQERLIREESVEQRRLVNLSLSPDPEKVAALGYAEQADLPSRMIYPDGRVIEIRRISPNGMPEYLTTLNLNAARTLSTDKVWPGGGEGYDLTGNGIVIGFWDGGIYRNTHVEFEDRAKIIDVFADTIGHATHVAGTAGAAGIDPRAKGMAGRSTLESYDWDNDLQEMDAAAGEGLLISNHSYGFITGWDYNSEEERWEWYGDINISEEEDYLFGFYHKETMDYDRIAYDNPNYLIVKSAGNDRGEGPSPGTEHYFFENGEWVPSTEVRQRDGGDKGYDSMGPVGNAKNILVVGAISDLSGGYTGREDVRITSFSAYGPTDDGRIKPDIVGNGETLYSAWIGSDTDYRSSSGTSMSAPNVSGSLATLQELYDRLNGSYLTSAELKGLVLHTSDDAGNPGPDYRFGWGVMNTLSAARVISDTSFARIREVSLLENDTFRIHLFSNGMEPARITICWTDPEGSFPEPALDPVKRMLVNDLDLRLIREVDGREFRPYVLDPLHPENQATTGDNQLDNVEQILLEAPEKGFYEVAVSYKESLFSGRQNFGLIISGLTEEYFASGTMELTGNNGEFILTSAGEYLSDMDAGWLITPSNGQPVKLYFDYFATEPGNDRMFIYDGTDDTAPLIATVDGTPDLEATEFNSTSGSLFVRFVSDGQVQDTGFRAIYCTIPPEDVPGIQGEPYPCAGSSEFYLATGVPGVDFIWEPPAGWTFSERALQGIDLSIGSSIDSLGVSAVNRCGEGQSGWLVLEPLDSVPSLDNFEADTAPCANTASFVEVDELKGAAYDWRLPADWLGTPTGNRLDYIPGRDPGTIRVSIRNACGPGDTLRVPISVKNRPGEVQILTSRENPCAVSEQEFYVEPLPDHSYLWEVGGDWSIIGEPEGDTILVSVGTESGFVFVDVTNKCGSRKSNKLFITAPRPEDPLVRVQESSSRGYKLLTITNALQFTGYQWYRNDSIIDSPYARLPEYIAYLPGTYTVSVMNSQGCVNRQDPADGKKIAQQNQAYTAYQGPGGKLIVFNSTNFSATVNIYSFSGRLILIGTISPGYNEIDFGRQGAFIINITGPDNSQTIRLFTN